MNNIYIMTKRTAMRSYKKRRTLRKMKRTMRRKLQRGGGPESLVIIVFLAIASSNPLFRMILDIILPLLGSNMISGGGNKFRQSGGGRFSDALIKFNEYVQANSDGTFSDEDKQIIAECVTTLTANPEVLEDAVAAPVSPDNADVNAAAAAFPTPTHDVLNSEGMKNYFMKIKDNFTKYINAKLDAKGITGEKRECMKKIISICIRVLFVKIQKIDLTSVIRDNYAKFLSAIAEKGKDMFQGAVNRGLGLMRSIRSRT